MIKIFVMDCTKTLNHLSTLQNKRYCYNNIIWIKAKNLTVKFKLYSRGHVELTIFVT